ncbi:LexA family protein [Pseudoalteromonas lipolytica]|uniref:LexA family protein n=1 Tax=Pseudoalteromonas lipolytica TaxID=570156 RepID=UPI00235485F0|nr:S24 family peptidase [Pseudoalteromonas lipolytica]|tara:strand:- start:1986 stop:2630 length:645 start_codon:yes stop_codon:yes gene_type:complete
MSFSERLISRMNILGVKGSELARQLGTGRASVSHWRTGQAVPSGENLLKLSKALRCNARWLSTGVGTPEGAVELELGPDLRGKAPLISWVQAGKWKEIDMESLRQASDISFYQHTASVSDDAFALRVKGDSMTSFTGGKSIPEGSVIIVDPNIQAEHGKVVVARLEESDEATLKQLVIDGGTKYLKPFNNSYPTMPINGNCTIIGVVKQVIQDF